MKEERMDTRKEGKKFKRKKCEAKREQTKRKKERQIQDERNEKVVRNEGKRDKGEEGKK